MKYTEALNDAVIEQIKQDIVSKDYTAIWEMLDFVPKHNLEQFFSEDTLVGLKARLKK